jgi:hypothetical protein
VLINWPGFTATFRTHHGKNLPEGVLGTKMYSPPLKTGVRSQERSALGSKGAVPELWHALQGGNSLRNSLRLHRLAGPLRICDKCGSSFCIHTCTMEGNPDIWMLKKDHGRNNGVDHQSRLLLHGPFLADIGESRSFDDDLQMRRGTPRLTALLAYNGRFLRTASFLHCSYGRMQKPSTGRTGLILPKRETKSTIQHKFASLKELKKQLVFS